jgi:hypothetical protein
MVPPAETAGGDTMRKEARVSYCRALVEKQVERGLSGAAFCREQKINPQRFYFWRRRFHSDSPGAGFVRLVPTAKTPCSGIRIFLDQGISIELDRGFDAFMPCEAIDETVEIDGPHGGGPFYW